MFEYTDASAQQPPASYQLHGVIYSPLFITTFALSAKAWFLNSGCEQTKNYREEIKNGNK